MTREEAIKVLDAELKERSDGYYSYLAHYGKQDKAEEEFLDSLHMAIAALREQEERSKAESEGRVIVLPCKVGDTVYQIRNKKHARGLGVSPRIVSSACVWTDGSYALCHQGMTYCQSRDLGKTWFLTQGEAEEALRRAEEDEGK